MTQCISQNLVIITSYNSMSMNNNSLNDSFLPEEPLNPEISHDRHSAVTFLRVSLPLCLLVGLPGNTLIILLMCRRRMRHNPAAKYLLSLGISDLGFDLVAVGGAFISKVCQLPLTLYSDTFCKINAFIYYVCTLFSGQILVCLSATRFYYAVKTIPSGAPGVLRKTRIIIGTVLLLAILSSSHVLILHRSVKQRDRSYRCRVANLTESRTELYTFLMTSYAYTLPSVLIGIFNFLTWLRYKKLKHNLRHTRAVPTTTTPQQLQENQVTKLLLVASLVFFLLTVPGNIFWWFTVILHSRLFCHWHARIWAIRRFIDGLQHSIGFYIYCLMARVFRQEFLQMCVCKRGRLVQPSGLRPGIRNTRTEQQGQRDMFTLPTTIQRP